MGETARVLGGLLGLVAVLGASAVTAQEGPLEQAGSSSPSVASFPSLDTLVAAAKDRSPAALEARARVTQREVEREEAILGLLPTFIATASYTRNQEEVGIPVPTSSAGTQTIVTQPLDQLDLRLRLELTLLDVGAFHRVGSSGLGVEVATLESDVTAEDVEREVLRAYWERVTADAVLAAADAALATAKANVQIVAVRRESDLATELDLARARAAVESAVRTRADATRLRGLASRKLVSLTGLDVSGPAPVVESSLESSPDEPGGPLVARVLLARKNLEVADEAATSEWLALVPRITASAEERLTNAAGFGPSPAYTLGLSAEWRLTAATFGAGRSAEARADLLRATAARAMSDAEAALADARLEVSYRIEAARAARAEAEVSEAARVSAEQLYVANKATQLEVVTAARDALQAKVERIRADADLELARALQELARRGSARTSP